MEEFAVKELDGNDLSDAIKREQLQSRRLKNASICGALSSVLFGAAAAGAEYGSVLVGFLVTVASLGVFGYMNNLSRWWRTEIEKIKESVLL